MALAEVLVLREDRDIAPAEVAGRVDHYLASFRAREKTKIRLALRGAGLLAAVRRCARRSTSCRSTCASAGCSGASSTTRRLADAALVRELRRALIRTAQQFCFIGYYGDARAARKAGYVPFSRRDASTRGLARRPDRRGVECMAPGDIIGERSPPVVMVGTGAGGAMLAYELAERGREVLLLERGAHVEPRDFTENEAEQLRTCTPTAR